jgi:hypothetical protein
VVVVLVQQDNLPLPQLRRVLAVLAPQPQLQGLNCILLAAGAAAGIPLVLQGLAVLAVAVRAHLAEMVRRVLQTLAVVVGDATVLPAALGAAA